MRRRNPISLWQLYEYDVWGNRRDGYEVNNVFRTSAKFEIDISWSNLQLIKELKKQGLLKKGIRAKSVNIEGDDSDVLYFSYRDRPEFELRKV